VKQLSYDKWINKIHQGDVIEVLKKMPDNLVDMVITSPPYHGLRDYGVDGQIGLESHPQFYIDKMVEVGREIRRVLKPNGSYFLNVGDSYAGGGMKRPGNDNPYQLETEKQRQSVIDKVHSQLKYDGKWIQSKQLLLVPSRLAIAMQDDGWTLRNDIVWQKLNNMPTSVKDRFNNSYEHVFFFTKNRKYYFDMDNIRIPHISKPLPKREDKTIVTLDEGLKNIKGWNNTGAKWSESQCDDDHINKQFTDKHDMHYDGTGYHPLGKNRPDVFTTDNDYEKSKYLSKEQEASVRQGFTKDRDPADFRNPLGKNRSDVFTINTHPTKEVHFATFPQELLEIPMKACCPERVCTKCGAPKVRITDFDENGKKVVTWEDWCNCNAGYEPGIVLDPFMGSGTTALLAKKMNRRWIGIELNPEYIEMATKRIGKNVVVYQYENKSDEDSTYDDFDFSV